MFTGTAREGGASLTPRVPMSDEQARLTAAGQRFCRETGFTEAQARELSRNANRAAKINEHECNGDPHPAVADRTDKNECAKLWSLELDLVTIELQKIAEPFGLTVEYTGLRPCLRNGREFIEIPH